jgi:hypothetical protein
VPAANLELLEDLGSFGGEGDCSCGLKELVWQQRGGREGAERGQGARKEPEQESMRVRDRARDGGDGIARWARAKGREEGKGRRDDAQKRR